mmetsp:Transcript_69466/g.208498  ORF Transcript_69466/g.208498 Transcript_69466/m.208498 type:complete len:777 (+) Transcript_69466:88-2418(+)
MTTPLKSEPSPDSDTTKSLQTAERALDDADDVSHLIQGGLDVAEAVLKVASAVPLLGPVCNVAKDILDDVRKCADKAHDVLEAGRRVCDILKTIQVMARHLERLGEQERTDLKELMDEVRAALFDMRDLVKSFGQRGWFKRLLQLSQHENTFRKLDRKIRDKMEMAMRLYRFAQDTATAETQKELEIFLVDRIYALEEALAAKVEECTDQGYTSQQALGVIEQDAGTLNELAHDAGISAAEMSVEILEFQAEVRKDFEQLQSGIDGLASSLTTGFDELKQLITGTASATRPLQPSRHSSGNSGERHALRNLTADHVVRMMHGLELGKYAAALHELPMTGAALAVADDNDLREAGVVNTLHRKLLLSKVDHFLSHDVPSYLLQSIEAHAAVKIQSIKRGNSARLRFQPSPEYPYPNLTFDKYRKQRIFSRINLEYPGVQLINEEPYIFLVRNFLGQSECNELIALLAASNSSAPSATARRQKRDRTSTTLIARSQEVGWLRERITKLTNMPKEHLEPTKLTRYAKGEYFLPHLDGAFCSQKLAWYDHLFENRSQESADDPLGLGAFPSPLCTVFTYLNDVPDGGRTTFCDVGKQTLLGRLPGDLADSRAGRMQSSIPERVNARQYFASPPPPPAIDPIANATSAVAAAAIKCLPPAPPPPPAEQKPPEPATDQGAAGRQVSITPRAGMAVVHFPSTTAEFKCFPDLRTQHEGEPAVALKFIAQQFIWSSPVKDVVPFLQKVQSEGPQRGVFYPPMSDKCPSLESYVAQWAGMASVDV